MLDYKTERTNDVNKILDSDQPRKVVVAGPGTGKSYLFEQIIKKKQKEGKNNFLAITFIGKLGDNLADDLAGLAKTMTLHGFARQFVLDNCPEGWEYYPKIKTVIDEDLSINGITKYDIGDSNYKARTNYYRAIGDDDVVFYAVEICKKNIDSIPKYDLILIDEFQDFNEIESDFIDLLSTKSETLIVGDDDQALYEFKGASPKHIRDKFSPLNTQFESHILRFCSRCTDAIIAIFNGIVHAFKLNEAQSDRIKKEYICYFPDKLKDNALNKKIIVLKDVKIGMIPTKIKQELEGLLQNQKIKSALIIGEARSCKKLLSSISKKLLSFGFKNVNFSNNEDNIFTLKQNLIDGYKILFKGKNDILAWRLLIQDIFTIDEYRSMVLANFTNPTGVVNNIAREIKNEQLANSKLFHKILNDPPSKIKLVADSSIDKLISSLTLVQKTKREVFINQLHLQSKTLQRPLSNISLTITSILGSKGLGADVVFLVGFDQGKLPSKKKIEMSEIYQMLVSLTRAKKRIYLIHTGGCEVSQFIEYMDKEYIEER